MTPARGAMDVEPEVVDGGDGVGEVSVAAVVAPHQHRHLGFRV